MPIRASWPDLLTAELSRGGDNRDAVDDDDDVELVDAIMGWDGDRCACAVCECPRFVDEANQTWCRDCREGRHWPAE